LKIDSLVWQFDSGWSFKRDSISEKEKANIVFIFGSAKEMKENLFFDSLRDIYPNAIFVGGSSAGTIYREELLDSGVVASVLQTENSRVELAIEEIRNIDDSFSLGERIFDKLYKSDLKHIIVLSDTININGSMLVNGLNSRSKGEIPISGGILAEESMTFSHAYVIANAPAKNLLTIGIGFYGDIETFYGSNSGWDDFGAERKITKSSGSVVYEIDGEPALDLYKKYLGDLSNFLPASGLRFPLNIWKDGEDDKAVIRTLMAIDESQKSLTFVGDVPEGANAKLMKTNIDGLIDGSEDAIKMTDFKKNDKSGYCLSVSCIGRRLVLDQLTEEELSVVYEHIGENVEMSGFYSYGEIAPFSKELKSCQFHNQTMTLTILQEKN
jgi:hypothetical protein